jgi:hypothetical protein
MNQIFLYDETSGMYDLNPDKIVKDNNKKIYAILTYDTYEERLPFLKNKKDDINRSLSNTNSTDGKIIIENNPIKIYSDGSVLLKNFSISSINPYEKELTCSQVNERTQSCNGISKNFNIFNLEMNGFMLKEITFIIGEDYFIVIGDDKNSYLKHILELMQPRFFVFGFTLFLLDFISYNITNINTINENLENFTGKVTEKITGLEYTDIEEFNIILNKFNSNAFNLRIVENEFKRFIRNIHPDVMTTFSILFNNKSINVKKLNKYQNLYGNAEKLHKLQDDITFNTIERIEKERKNTNTQYMNGIEQIGILNYEENDEKKKIQKCVCTDKELNIDGNIIKSCGNYIFDLDMNVCNVNNASNCKQVFKYKNSPYYFSMCNSKGNPVSYTKPKYEQLLLSIEKSMDEAITYTKDVQLSIDDTLSRSFERLEFYNSRNMSILTIVSTIFLPISFLSGWYGMNLSNMPEYELTYVYPVLTALTLLIFIGYLYLYRDILFLKDVKYERKRK